MFGPHDPRTPNTRSQTPPPKMAILGWGWGWDQGARVGGAPGVPSLVFLERLNGKRLTDGRSPTWPQGTPPGADPPCPRQKPPIPPPGLVRTVGARRPGSDATPRLCPTSAGGR